MNQPNPSGVRCERIGRATLYLGDCRPMLAGLEYDAVLTDPPYGIGLSVKTRSTVRNDCRRGRKETYRTDFAPIVGDDAPFDPTPFIEGPSILWGAQNYASRLPDSNGWLCWHKTGGVQGFNMSECELAWTNVLKSTRHFDHMWHGYKRASQYGQKVLHPTEKPIALMRWCLNFLPNAGVILDPFMGSGTTGVAALQSGRSFIGMEIDEAHFETAVKRVRAASGEDPGPLFGEAA